MSDRMHLPTDPSCYADALARVWDLRPEIAASLTDYRDPAEIPAGTAYVADDGLSGFIVTDGAEIVGLFSGERGRGDALVSDAIDAGGWSLDCFDGYLTALYQRHGFRVTSREPNWTPGQPDVVFLSLSRDTLKG